MQCGLMKKVNCAEEIEPQSLSLPAPRMASDKQSPLFVSLLSRQSDMCFCNCIVFLLMATLSTSQMNARWNGESSGIMRPAVLLAWLRCSRRHSRLSVWKRRRDICTYRSYLQHCSVIEISVQWVRHCLMCSVADTVCFVCFKGPIL